MKNIDEYEAYIVDLDGTLYFQPSLRIGMCMKLLGYYCAHLSKIRDLYIIYKYRKVREEGLFNGTDDFEEKEYSYVAEQTRQKKQYVKSILKLWMIDKPLKIIKEEKDTKLLLFLTKQMKAGKKVIIYSDYPTYEKLEALEFQPNFAFYSGDKEIGCLKPDNKGLENILKLLEQYKVDRRDVLYIGDRFKKDGLCAKSSGIDFYILKRNKLARRLCNGKLF